MVFKAYDIRGEYGKDVTEELFNSIGKSVHVLGKINKVVVGHDMRDSSKPLKEALIEGLLKSGISVIDIGLATTPMLYYASGTLDVDMGIVITASHNPGKDNGMKLCWKNAVPIAWDTGIKRLKEAVDSKDYQEGEEGELFKYDFSQEYKTAMKQYCKPKKSLRVVFDAGNGMGGFLDNEILSEYCDLECLYCELDGNFPNHEANPIKEETLLDLKQEVKNKKADVGFAFDGDADRMGLVDEKGNFVPADLLAAFLIDHYIKIYPDEGVYSFDLRSSKVLQDVVNKASKKFYKTRVGHSFIKETMLKTRSFFSSELSGHYYFWFGDMMVFDSALRVAMETLQILSEENRTLSECIESYRVYIKSQETNFEVKDKDLVLQKLQEQYSDAEIESIDGITFNYSTHWFNVRASNTENILRLNLEANDQETYDRIYASLCNYLNTLK